MFCKAIKKIYDYEKHDWNHSDVEVEINRKSFSQGALRSAHVMRIKGDTEKYVAKFFIDMYEPAKQYYDDVIMQMEAKHYAKRFSEETGLQVDFIDVFVICFTDQTGKSHTCVAEKFVEGKFEKFNNNDGWDSGKRNTPDAFSHYTWKKSANKMIICDIQGIGNLWTDPQILTVRNTSRYGRANIKMRGISKFLANHRCNNICQKLGLDINAGQQALPNNSKLGGIGVFVVIDGKNNLVVESVKKGGVAEIGKLQKGDIICGIDKQIIDGLTMAEVKNMIIGQCGTNVEIDYLSNGVRKHAVLCRSAI